MSFDPATIAAYVDGEVDDLTARRIEREAEADAALAAAIARERGLKDRLRSHFAPVLDEPLPGRLTQLLQADAAVDTSLTERRAARQARFGGGQWGAMQWGAMAAALVLGLTVGMQPWGPTSPVAVESGALVASGPLAAALDTQLASNQPADAATRIGLRTGATAAALKTAPSTASRAARARDGRSNRRCADRRRAIIARRRQHRSRRRPPR